MTQEEGRDPATGQAVNRTLYLAEVIRLYLEAPGAPVKANRRDWQIAGDLYRRAIQLPHLAHAIRLATLRRSTTPNPAPIRSLAYYRAVLEAITEPELDNDYCDYVRRRYDQMHNRG